MAWGSAVMEAVGAGAEEEGGRADGGGRVLAFFPQPVTASRAMDALKRIVVSLGEREVCLEIVLSTVRGPRVRSQAELNNSKFGLRLIVYGPIRHLALSGNIARLPPAPVRHVGAGAGEGSLLRTVGEHGHDACVVGTAVGRVCVDEMTAVRRPGGEVAATSVVRELNPFFRGDLHDVDVLSAGGARTVLAIPGEGDELAVGGP